MEGEELEVGDCGVDFDELVGRGDAHVLEEGVLDLGGLEGVEDDEEGELSEEGEVVAGAALVERSVPKLSENSRLSEVAQSQEDTGELEEQGRVAGLIASQVPEVGEARDDERLARLSVNDLVG